MVSSICACAEKTKVKSTLYCKKGVISPTSKNPRLTKNDLQRWGGSRHGQHRLARRARAPCNPSWVVRRARVHSALTGWLVHAGGRSNKPPPPQGGPRGGHERDVETLEGHPSSPAELASKDPAAPLCGRGEDVGRGEKLVTEGQGEGTRGFCEDLGVEFLPRFTPRPHAVVGVVFFSIARVTSANFSKD